MGRPLKIKKTTTVDIGYPPFSALEAVVKNTAGTLNDNQYIQVVGGDDSANDLATLQHPVIKCRVRIVGFSEADGYIIRQKGSTKYLVTDGTNTGVCILANEADGALTAGNMNMTFSLDDSTANRIKRLTNRYLIDYSNNRHLVNFFTDEGTMIKSGTKGDTLQLGIIESYV